jgi:hypothetical protein
MNSSQWELLVRTLLTILRLLLELRRGKEDPGHVMDTFTDQTIAKLESELRHGR